MKKKSLRKAPLKFKGSTAPGLFTKLADRASQGAGSTPAFMIAFGLVIIWAATGPLFHFSSHWQFIINNVTNIITFLLVFLIQHSQNRDTRAIHLKLDELIRATKGAHTVMLNLEKLSQEELEEIHRRYEALAKEARQRLREGKSDTDVIGLKLKQH